MAKIAVVTWGTRGDVSPFCAIAHALIARGHDVVVAAPEDHVAFVQRSGLRSFTLAGSSADVLDSPESRQWLDSGDALAMLRQLDIFVRRLAPVVATQLDTFVDTHFGDVVFGSGPDVIVCGLLVADLCGMVGEQRGIPVVVGHACPVLPSAHVQNALIDVEVPRALFKPTSALALRLIWLVLGDIARAERRRRGLPRGDGFFASAHQRRGGVSLHLWSETLQEKPADWRDNDVVTGFCALPRAVRERLGERRALDDLEAFLAAGAAPVFIGAGSMPIVDEAAFVDDVVAAARRARCRVILGGTWRDVAAVDARLPATIKRCGAVDHDALFPRCSAIVHHGGAGTTATALRAGRPQLIVAVLGDQAFWGRRVNALGVGGFVRFKDLDVDVLTRLLRRLHRHDVRDKAKAAAIAVRDDDGPLQAALAIERCLGT